MPETPRIPELNDAFRKGEKAHLGRIMLTQGIRHSRGSRPLGDLAVHIKVQTFADFSEDNDPHGEHDFGSFEFAGEKCLWKINYYHPSMEAGSTGR